MRKSDAAITAKGNVSDGNIKLVLGHKDYAICQAAVHTMLPKAGTSAGGDSISHVASGMPYEEFMRMMSENGKKSGRNMREDPLGMDLSAFNADSAQMIRECEGTVYGYVRVSTDHQDYARQIEALKKLGVKEKNIFKDKKSGKDFNRNEFRRLMQVIKAGDCIVVLELDRFGRNMMEIKNHWYWITQQRQTNIVVVDQPILNTKLGTYGLGNFIAELILAVFSLMAEIERNLINKRMGDGLRRVKLEGKKLGRKKKPIPSMFWKQKESFLNKEKSQNQAARELGVDSKTFRNWMEKTGTISTAEEWERLAAEIEKDEKAERIRQARIEYGEEVIPLLHN